MGLRVVGAGLPRTGTTSLKATLEQLLGGRCYHMAELGQRVEHDGPLWWSALNGDPDQLDELLAGWDAAVDWPASIFWRELADHHPDAPVILSRRSDSAAWWRSADETVWEVMRRVSTGDDTRMREFQVSMRRAAGLGDDWDDEAVARAWYDAHNAAVVEAIPPERLLVWQPSDGPAPIAERLGLPTPDGPAIHANTTAEFRTNTNLDGEAPPDS